MRKYLKEIYHPAIWSGLYNGFVTLSLIINLPALLNIPRPAFQVSSSKQGTLRQCGSKCGLYIGDFEVVLEEVFNLDTLLRVFIALYLDVNRGFIRE
jgi:hypothetical protein